MVVIRRNSKANAALGGLERGLVHGLQIGQRQQQIDIDKQEAMRRAMIVDYQMQQDASERGAMGEAAGAMLEGDPLQGSPPSPSQAGAAIGGAMGGGGAVAAGGAIGAQDQQAIQRVKSIAQRLPPKYAASFVQEAAERHKKKIDEREKKTIGDETTRGVAAGSYFVQQPDGTRISTQGVDDAIKKLTEAAGDPKSTASEVGALKANLDREHILAKSTYEHVQRTVQNMRSRIAQAEQPATPGPQSAAQFEAQQARMQKMQMILTTYEHVAPQKMGGDPKAWQEWQSQIGKEWSMAENNIAYESEKYGAVSFEAAAQMRRAEADARAADMRASQALEALRARELQDVGPAAADRAKNADARMMDAQRPRGPAAGTGPERSPSDEDLYLKAEKAVLDRQDPKKPLTPEQLHAETLKAMGRIKSAKRGFESIESAKSAGNTDAPGGQGIAPEDAARAGWTDEEWLQYEKDKTVPAGKPIK